MLHGTYISGPATPSSLFIHLFGMITSWFVFKYCVCVCVRPASFSFQNSQEQILLTAECQALSLTSLLHRTLQLAELSMLAFSLEILSVIVEFWRNLRSTPVNMEVAAGKVQLRVISYRWPWRCRRTSSQAHHRQPAPEPGESQMAP